MSDIVCKELPSGAKLEITPAPWETSKALYKSIASEAVGLKLDPKTEVDVNLYKDLLLTAVASDKIEAKLWECLTRCTYNGIRISKDTFEPMAARGDYLIVCFEVAVVNVSPFMSALLSKYGAVFQNLVSSLASGPKTTT